jgi:hypothetical protein
VNHPQFDAIRLKDNGISAAKIAASQRPARRAYGCSLLIVYTMIIPISDKQTRNIMHGKRLFLTYVVVMAMNAKPVSWNPPPGIVRGGW